MRPSKFIDYQERRLGRDLSGLELQSVLAARASCGGGDRDTVRAMRNALARLLPEHELSEDDRVSLKQQLTEHTRIQLRIEKGVLAQIDAMVGEEGRAQFIRQAVNRMLSKPTG